MVNIIIINFSNMVIVIFYYCVSVVYLDIDKFWYVIYCGVIIFIRNVDSIIFVVIFCNDVDNIGNGV